MSPTEIVFPLIDDADSLRAVVQLARREKACCSFFTFTLEIEVESVALKIGVPAEATALLDQFEAAATP